MVWRDRQLGSDAIDKYLAKPSGWSAMPKDSGRSGSRNVDHRGTANFLVNRRMNSGSRCGGREMAPIWCSRSAAQATTARLAPGLETDLTGSAMQTQPLRSGMIPINDEARCRIIPAIECSNRHAAPDPDRGRRSSTRSSCCLLLHLAQRSVDGRRAHCQQTASHLRREFEMTVPLH